jgi:hypothetical protein
MWILNSGLPEARLQVKDVIKANENKQMHKDISLRLGV